MLRCLISYPCSAFRRTMVLLLPNWPHPKHHCKWYWYYLRTYADWVWGPWEWLFFFKYIYWWIIELTMSTAITNTQQIETVIIQQIFISRQARANRLLIYGELYQHTSKQDVEKQRSSSLASRNICVDCLAIGRQDNQCRRPKHSLWLNKRYIWNSKTKIVIYRHSKGTEGFSSAKHVAFHCCSTVASC